MVFFILFVVDNKMEAVFSDGVAASGAYEFGTAQHSKRTSSDGDSNIGVRLGMNLPIRAGSEIVSNQCHLFCVLIIEVVRTEDGKISILVPGK